MDLKIDLDRDFPNYQDHITEREVLRIVDVLEFFLIDVRYIDIRHSNKGLHIRIGFNRSSISWRHKTLLPIIQMACGSHYKRELWNYFRIVETYRTKPVYMWNILFNYKHRLSDGYKSMESERCVKCQQALLQYRKPVSYKWDGGDKASRRYIMTHPDNDNMINIMEHQLENKIGAKLVE